MGEFDIYKWNSQRRLAAVNEGVEEGASDKYENYLNIIKTWLKNVPSAGSIHNYIDANRGLIIRDMMSADFDDLNQE